jgi:hypothetical protein
LMNARRLMHLPKPEDDILPHQTVVSAKVDSMSGLWSNS